MKKLLYTFILSAIVISCDKGYEESISAPQALEQEIDLLERFNAFNDLIAGAKFPDVTPSSNKGGDNGSNWIELAWFASGEEGYVYLRPEELGNGCYDNIISDASNIRLETYTLVDADNLNIQVGDGDGQTFALPESLKTRYSQAFASPSSSIFFADYGTQWTVRFGVLPTATIND